MVFDVGGVLLDWDPRHLYRKLIPDPAEMEWFLANKRVARYDFLRRLAGVVVSGFEGIAKPDREIYELLLCLTTRVQRAGQPEVRTDRRLEPGDLAHSVAG